MSSCPICQGPGTRGYCHGGAVLWCKFRARRRLGLGVSTCYAWLRRDLAQADDDQFASFYERHLRSKPWKALRERALRRAGSRCESPQCSSSVSIGVEVHHLTYERLGHERLSDVIVLCRPCHREHGHKLHARARGATGQ